ncbi:MAG: RtcB family protein [Nitrospirae bacterium]|nr:RtcB family protein [Nitrospirota bacterium]MBI3352685.1 RtcB family protein [Nitrospirota bacterium]
MTIQLKKLDPYRYEIPIGSVPGMNVPGLIFSDSVLLKDIQNDQSIEQVANTACLPGIVKAALAMPDIHCGYGFPIGGVVATDANHGAISPGGVGFDINCGVRLVKTALSKQAVDAKMESLIGMLSRDIPTGTGSFGDVSLTESDYEKIFRTGAGWSIQQGFGRPEDLDTIESNGCLEGVNPEKVSPRARERGKKQLGTLGSGNHFIEVQYVETLYSKQIASVFGLVEKQVVVMIHSGSRGLGHQVCTDFLKMIGQASKQYGYRLPDRQLACVPVTSDEGKDYLSAMNCAANYAWANRQCLMGRVESAMVKALDLSPETLGASLLYDIAHNIVKLETHQIDGKPRKVAVHRKGATRAFPAGHPEVPAVYQSTGHPVIVPGDMGRYSYVLVGNPSIMEETFGSSCHGAGRILSRSAALRATEGRSIISELKEIGVTVKGATKSGIREEAPEAYKDVARVVEVMEKAGLVTKVARLRPMGAIKG